MKRIVQHTQTFNNCLYRISTSTYLLITTVRAVNVQRQYSYWRFEYSNVQFVTVTTTHLCISRGRQVPPCPCLAAPMNSLPAAVCHRTLPNRIWKRISSNNDELHPAPMWSFLLFWRRDTSVTNLLTYLFTYLLSCAGTYLTGDDCEARKLQYPTCVVLQTRRRIPRRMGVRRQLDAVGEVDNRWL